MALLYDIQVYNLSYYYHGLLDLGTFVHQNNMMLDRIILYDNDWGGTQVQVASRDNVGYRTDVGRNSTQLTIGNYIVSSDSTLMLRLNGQSYKLNRTAGGNAFVSLQSFSVANSTAVSLSVYRAREWCPQLDNQIPLWSGYVYPTTNDTFIGLYGNMAAADIHVTNGVNSSHVDAPAIPQQLYTFCNFVPALNAAGEPQPYGVDDVIISLGSKPGVCTYLQNAVSGGVVPYGQCKQFIASMYPDTQVLPLISVNGAEVPITLGYANSPTALQLRWTRISDSTQSNVIAALYLDHDAPWDGYKFDTATSSVMTSVERYINGTRMDMGSFITGTLTPASGSVTLRIGFYANNFLKVHSPVIPLYVSIDNTYWGSCYSEGGVWGLSCYYTVPQTAYSYTAHNVSVYSSACYGAPDTCSKYYITSTLVILYDASVNLIAFYGDFATEGALSCTLLRGGANVSTSCPIGRNNGISNNNEPSHAVTTLLLIIIPSVVGLGIVIAILLFCCRRYRTRKSVGLMVAPAALTNIHVSDSAAPSISHTEAYSRLIEPDASPTAAAVPVRAYPAMVSMHVDHAAARYYPTMQ